MNIKQLYNQLKEVDSEVTMQKIPKERKADEQSLKELSNRITSRLKADEEMQVRSTLNA